MTIINLETEIRAGRMTVFSPLRVAEPPTAGACASDGAVATSCPKVPTATGKCATTASVKGDLENGDGNGVGICHDSRVNLPLGSEE